MLREISCVKDFYSVLFDAGVCSDSHVSAWKNVESFISSANTFFRGQPRKYQSISSSISRNNNYLRNEYQMYSETVDTKKDELSAFSYPVEKLSKMQHYGLPTRMIDFTIDPLIALFFAIQDVNPEESGAVYIFQCAPKDYHDLTPRLISLLPTLDRLSVESIIASYFETFGKVVDKSTVLENVNSISFIKYSSKIEATNPRLYNQKGTFAICGNVIDANGMIGTELNQLHIEDASTTILIPGAYKQHILNELRDRFDIDENYIYPEFTAWTEYMKRKYSSDEFSPDTLYWIVDSNNSLLPDFSCNRIKVILNKPLNTDDIKRIGNIIFSQNKGVSDSLEVQIYSNFDNYTMRHWIAQCRWVSNSLEKKHWPFFYDGGEDNDLDWELNAQLTTKEEYFHDEVFKDPKLLIPAYHKYYKLLLEPFYQLDTAYEEMEDAHFAAEAMKRHYLITASCEHLFKLGRAKDNNLDSYLCMYTDFASSLEMICLLSENYSRYNDRYSYMLQNLLWSCQRSLKDIKRNKQKWFQAFEINSADIDTEINDSAVTHQTKFTQTKEISCNAIEIYINVEYHFSNDELIICGSTNLFDYASLCISLSRKFGQELQQEYCIVQNQSFEFSVPKKHLVARHYSVDISLGFPRTQSRNFIDLAGQEYEFLTGPLVEHSGLNSHLSFHDYFQCTDEVIVKTDFATC